MFRFSIFNLMAMTAAVAILCRLEQSGVAMVLSSAISGVMLIAPIAFAGQIMLNNRQRSRAAVLASAPEREREPVLGKQQLNWLINAILFFASLAFVCAGVLWFRYAVSSAG